MVSSRSNGPGPKGKAGKAAPFALGLPEMGQWPDRLAPVAAAAALMLTTAGFLMAFFFIAPVNGASVDGVELIGDQMVSNKLLFSQKIFYFHMPVAITSMAVMVAAALYALRYLTTRQQRYDTCSKTAMEVALVFVVATMITGEMWTRFEWGVWWSWEPRLTTYLVLTILVLGYFILRNAIDEPERRATYASVLALISFVDVPITMLVTRVIPTSLHPVVFREGGMTPEMGLCVGICAAGFLCLAFVMYRIRFRNARLEERVSALKNALED